MLTSLWVEFEFVKHQIIPIFGALSTTAWYVIVDRLHHKVPQFNDFSLYGAKKRGRIRHDADSAPKLFAARMSCSAISLQVYARSSLFNRFFGCLKDPHTPQPYGTIR